MTDTFFKVLFIPGSYHPSTSGPGNFVKWTSEGLFRNGHDVKIISRIQPGNSQNWIPLKWYSSECGSICYVKSRWWQLHLPYLIRIYKEMKKADVVHLNSLFHPFCIFLGLYALWKGKKNIIWSVHGSLYKRPLLKSANKKKLFIFLLKRFGQHVNIHVSSSRELECVRAFLPKANIFVVPTLLNVVPRRSEYQESKKYIVFVGRIHPIKGLEILFEALSKSHKFRNSDYTLKVLGEGSISYTNQLIRSLNEFNLQDKVEFLGQLEGRDKNNVIEQARTLILPSYSEGFGNVVLESLALGTPVIATEGTPWQVLNERKAGYWVGLFPQAITDAIEEIISMPKESYIALREKSFELAKESFDFDTQKLHWLKTYSRIQSVNNL